MHITYPINALPRAIPLCLGVQSEYGARPIFIDVSAWVERWPDIVVSVQPVRPGEDASYTAVDVAREGNVITWTPNAYDTEIPGSGSVEIVGLADGVKIIRTGAATSITATLTSTSKVPEEPLAAWADSILKAGEQAKMDADRAADEADDAQRHAGDALASAESAASSAESSAAQVAEATEQANDAKAAADAAQQHADAAAASAQAAAGSAADLDEAVKAAALAGEHEAAAETHANRAAEKAESARQYSMGASQYKSQAGSSAAHANTYKNAAEAAATEAAEAAANAKAKADAAADDAQEAAEHAASASTSAGNASASEQVAQNSAETASAAQTAAEAAAIRAETALANIPDDYTALAEAVRLKAQAIVNEQSGEVVVLTDAEPDEALSLVSHIDAADGATEVSLTRTGRNLADINADTTSSGVSIYAQNGVVTVDGKATSGSTVNVKLGTILLQPGTYTLSHKVIAGGIDNAPDDLSVLACLRGNTRLARTRLNDPEISFTVSAETEVSIVLMRASTSYPYNQFAIEVQIEAGGTATAFEPPQHQTLTAALPETVAAGALDWITGALTINEDGASRTVQLVPQELDLLKGYNTLWSSTGDTYVRYTADLKSYIDSKLAAIAASVLNV